MACQRLKLSLSCSGADDQILFGQIVVDPDRRGEAPQPQRRPPTPEAERAFGVLSSHNPLASSSPLASEEVSGMSPPFDAYETERERHGHRQLLVLPGVGASV